MQSMSAGGWEEPSWEPSPGLEKSTPSCWDAAQGRVGIPSPWELPVLAPGQQEKKEKRSQFLCVRGGESVISSFFSGFLGMLYLHFSSLFLSLGQNLPRRAGGVLLGMLNQEQPVPYQFSVSRGGREGPRKEGVPWPNPLQQRPQSRVGIQGSALPSVHGFALATLGLKVGF